MTLSPDGVIDSIGSKSAIQKAMTTTEVQERSKPEAFRFVLRRATRTAHESLDAHPAFGALMAGALSIEGYRRLMVLFHAFYRRHDPILEHACSVHAVDRFGFAYASRTPTLVDDLAALGNPVAQSRINAPSLPLAESVGALGGFLYVFEGSMLGGAVLSRAVATLLAPYGAGGDGYWLWCRDAGGERWAMTCAMLDNLATTEAAKADMVGSALAAFSTFGQWLDCWEDDSLPDFSWPESIGRC